MITIHIQTEGGVTALMPEGRLDTVNSNDIDKALEPLLLTEKYLIVDFSSCSYLSSTGIRSLLKAAKKLGANGGFLVLSNVSPEIFQVLEMAGLHKIFKLFKNRKEAQQEITKAQNTSETAEIEVGTLSLHLQSAGKGATSAYFWDNAGIAGYNELAISAGFGKIAEAAVEDSPEGLFVTTGNCAFFIPSDPSHPSDFRIPQNAASAGVFVQKAFSFGNHPSHFATMKGLFSGTISQLIGILSEVKKKLKGDTPVPVAMVVADFNSVQPSFWIVCSPCGDGFSGEVLGARIVLETAPSSVAPDLLQKTLKEILTFENILETCHLDPKIGVSGPDIWFFIPDKCKDASAVRTQIETATGTELGAPVEFLVRRLYTDSSKIVLKKLHGGYSAQTFQVESFDSEGRKLRPTVLKVGNRAMIERESDHCQRYALPYILNNSAMVLGAEFYGDTGALRYNFVGIGGEQTQLKWLTHYFEAETPKTLEPLFDKIFLQILAPWYRQPVQTTIRPFLEHDPTLTFFPAICQMAEEQFGISSDDKNIVIEETGQTLLNPYWFLKHEFPRRHEEPLTYPTSICHGDLNMQNILLDQKMNVYLIDFSETKPRSVVSDFARLEAIFMIEHARLDSHEELVKMIEFATRFYAVDCMGQLPENTYKGAYPEEMDKNITMIRRMRSYASQCTLGNTTMFPYFLALLEWMLPIVCYSSAGKAQKRFSTVIAGLLCEKIESTTLV